MQPVIQSNKRIPFSRREKVSEKLIELEELDVIEKVTGPTRWLSPLVAVEKPNGDVRICIDMRQPNQAIIRERHPVPTVEETIQEMSGGKVFSKLLFTDTNHFCSVSIWRLRNFSKLSVR